MPNGNFAKKNFELLPDILKNIKLWIEHPTGALNNHYSIVNYSGVWKIDSKIPLKGDRISTRAVMILKSFQARQNSNNNIILPVQKYFRYLW